MVSVKVVVQAALVEVFTVFYVLTDVKIEAEPLV